MRGVIHLVITSNKKILVAKNKKLECFAKIKYKNQ